MKHTGNGSTGSMTAAIDLEQLGVDLQLALTKAGVPASSAAFPPLFKLISDDVLWYLDRLDPADLEDIDESF